MKQLFFLLKLLVCVQISYSQKFQANFLGEDFMLYKGVYLKLRDDALSDFHFTFYSDLVYCQSPYNNNVIYPDREYKFQTIKDSLANRIFVVENIIDKEGNTFKSSSFLEQPIFVLKDTSTNQIIYYKYDRQYAHNFPFNTSKILYDEKELCSKIEREHDEFTGIIKLNSPILSGYEIASIIIFKRISKTGTSYYLSLTTIGSSVHINGKGAIILFEDGSRWTKSIEIDVEADRKGFEYSAYIQLTVADLNTFSTKKIRKYRLYLFDEEISPAEADKFRIYVKCIRNLK